MGVGDRRDLTSDESFQATLPFLLGAFTLIILLVGVLLRSYWASAMAGVGLAMTLLWARMLSNIVGFEESIVLDVIVPIATISFGIDFMIHAVGRCREELAHGTPYRSSYVVGIASVGGALVLALSTSSIAFGSNATSGIPAVIQFGFGAAIALTRIHRRYDVAAAEWVMRGKWRRWSGRDSGKWGRCLSSAAAGRPCDRLGTLGRARWRGEDAARGARGRTGASLRGRSVGRMAGQLRTAPSGWEWNRSQPCQGATELGFQGQRCGRCRVRRRAERVSRPAREKNRRRRVLVVAICSPRPTRAVQRARLWAVTCTASQAPLAAKRPDGMWFRPTPYLRSRMAFSISAWRRWSASSSRVSPSWSVMKP